MGSPGSRRPRATLPHSRPFHTRDSSSPAETDSLESPAKMLIEGLRSCRGSQSYRLQQGGDTGENPQRGPWKSPWVLERQGILVCAKSFQSCPTVYDATDYSPPGSSVHGILQARILEWVAMPSSRGSSQPRDQTHISCIAGTFFPS